MLNIYLENCNDVILCNDYFFSTETYSLVLEDKKLRDLIETIEDVKFVDKRNVISKFNQECIGLNLISTGCKTVINIVTHPELIFTSDECGINLLEYIYKIKMGSIFMRNIRYPACNVENDLLLHIGNREIPFINTNAIREWFRNEK